MFLRNNKPKFFYWALNGILYTAKGVFYYKTLSVHFCIRTLMVREVQKGLSIWKYFVIRTHVCPELKFRFLLSRTQLKYVQFQENL